jgi:uncharacterized glyoxalase superfamily protein PhnB
MFSVQLNSPGEIMNNAAIRQTRLDLTDLLHAKLAYLNAMLMMTYAEPGEAFRCFCEQTQDEYMGACSSVADECRELFRQLAAGGSL